MCVITSAAVAGTAATIGMTMSAGAAATAATAINVGIAISTVASVAGSIYSAVNQYQQGQYQEKLANAQANIQNEQAALDRRRAQQALDQAEIEKQDQRRRTRALVGSGKAALAGNGVMLESRDESLGSMWEQDANIELAYDNAKIQHNAEMTAWGYRTSAAITDEQAMLTRTQGKYDRIFAERSAVATGITGTLGGLTGGMALASGTKSLLS